MNTKLVSIISGLLLATGMSVANAQEPMQLTAAQMDTVSAGVSGHFSQNIWLDQHIRDRKDARFNVHTNVRGNSAVGNATADAFGRNTDAQTWTASYTDPFTSQAGSKSVSLTDDSWHY
ncbi:MAG: hypothetical protein V3U75_02585 [Methylococcaceae bacterium]